MARKLARRLGFWDSALFEVGGLIGAGIFVLLGLATDLSGPAVILAVALGGIVSLITALSYAEISSAIPLEGGEYEYAHRLLSPLAGILVAVGWLATDIISGSVVSLGFAIYLAVLLPVPLQVGAIGVVALVTLVNAFGVQLTAKANNVLTAIKIGVLALFVFITLGSFNPANLAPFTPLGYHGILAGAALFFFAYSGFGKITRLGEEVKDPQRTLPRAILAALSTTTLLYILVAIGLVGSIGWVAAAATRSPLTGALSSLGWPNLAKLVALGALAATFSVLLTNNASISRMLYAVARRNKDLANLSELHARFQTPWKAIVLTGALTAVLVAFVKLSDVATFSSFLILLYYAAINVIALAARQRKDWRPRFRTPLYPLFPVLGIAASAILLAALATPSA